MKFVSQFIFCFGIYMQAITGLKFTGALPEFKEVLESKMDWQVSKRKIRRNFQHRR
jgi:hypothetical protein